MKPDLKLNRVVDFVKEETGYDRVHADSDLHTDVGLDGDDFHELIYKFSSKFNVDIEDYRWYFHAGEEGFNPFELLFKPPSDRVKRIPITPRVLAEFVEKSEWNLVYPQHQLPKVRYDKIIALIVLGTIGILLSILLFYKYFFI